jgi:hypothetical protein
MTPFSPRIVETLIDLVEIKLSYLDITDREDRQEWKLLRTALAQLSAQRRMLASVH